MFNSAGNIYEQLLIKLNECTTLAAQSRDAQLFLDGLIPIITTLVALNKQRDEFLAEQSEQVDELIVESNESVRLNLDASNIALSNIEEVLNLAGPETIKQLDIDEPRAEALGQTFSTIKNLLGPIQIMLESAIQQTENADDEEENEEDEIVEF